MLVIGKPSLSMGHLYHGELLVITRWYLYVPIVTDAWNVWVLLWWDLQKPVGDLAIYIHRFRHLHLSMDPEFYFILGWSWMYFPPFFGKTSPSSLQKAASFCCIFWRTKKTFSVGHPSESFRLFRLKSLRKGRATAHGLPTNPRARRVSASAGFIKSKWEWHGV